MWDLVGNPEDRFSHNEAHLVTDSLDMTSVVYMDVKQQIKHTDDDEKIKRFGQLEQIRVGVEVSFKI